MTQDEVLKLALEALEGLINRTSSQSIYSFMETERRIAMSACVGIREALAQPEQEPVGYADKTTIKYLQEGLMRKAALVSKDEAMLEGEDADIPLYTTPPQRTWVGLKDDEKSELWGISCAVWPRYITYANVVEAKLKQKNGYAEEKNT